MVIDYGSFSWPSSEVGSNPSVGPTGVTAPVEATEIGFIDAGGLLQGVSPTEPLPVTGSVSSSPNTNGASATATIASATAVTKPANTVSFILQCDASSTDYIRWCDSNSTASASNGFVLQPGQDTGIIPMSHDLSICPHSASQVYNIQWILSS